MKYEPEKIEFIYTNYINGNLKDMVNLIDEYGQYQFWIDLFLFLRGQDSDNNKYIRINQAYCLIKAV